MPSGFVSSTISPNTPSAASSKTPDSENAFARRRSRIPEVLASIFSRSAKSIALVMKASFADARSEADAGLRGVKHTSAMLVVPIPYLADEIPREPVARLKQRLGADDGKIDLNHHLTHAWRRRCSRADPSSIGAGRVRRMGGMRGVRGVRRMGIVLRNHSESSSLCCFKMSFGASDFSAASLGEDIVFVWVWGRTGATGDACAPSCSDRAAYENSQLSCDTTEKHLLVILHVNLFIQEMRNSTVFYTKILYIKKISPDTPCKTFRQGYFLPDLTCSSPSDVNYQLDSFRLSSPRSQALRGNPESVPVAQI